MPHDLLALARADVPEPDLTGIIAARDLGPIRSKRETLDVDHMPLERPPGAGLEVPQVEPSRLATGHGKRAPRGSKCQRIDDGMAGERRNLAPGRDLPQSNAAVAAGRQHLPIR